MPRLRRWDLDATIRVATTIGLQARGKEGIWGIEKWSRITQGFRPGL